MKCIFFCFLKYRYVTGWRFVAEGFGGVLILSPKEPRSITWNFYLWNQIEAILMIWKFQNFYFLRITERYRGDNFWYHGQLQLFMLYQLMKNIFWTKLDPCVMHKTHRDHIIPHLHTLIGFFHQRSMEVVEATFHGTKVNLHDSKF